MRKRVPTFHWAFPLSLLLAGCSGGATNAPLASGTTTDGDSGTVPSGDGARDGSAGSPASPAKKSCEDLIACVADVDPSTAGGLVTLYGDASNCWKGSASDADACGKACAKVLEDRPECSAAPLDRHYLALCTSSLADGDVVGYDVDLSFDPRTGGSATFRPLPLSATTYHAADALVTQPKLDLTIETGGGAGESTTAFDVPRTAFTVSSAATQKVHFVRFGVKRLRVEKNTVCSDVDVAITSPFQTEGSGACIYLPHAEGTAIPSLSSSEITNCKP